ncbi:MAG: hypothetical protein JKY53_07255 [Flavobacteriales bacterium]|nr:hypothetical protein [Flavobacteriales bacterium]
MLERKFHSAGKAEDIEQNDILFWSKKSVAERLAYSYNLHLLNHNIDPATFKFKRVFVKAFKR